MENNTRKRKVLSISDKVDIMHKLENEKTNAQVAEQFNLNRSTVSTIWKNRETILKSLNENNIHLKRLRTCRDTDIERNRSRQPF